MPARALALALALVTLASPAWADAGRYSAPANAGVDNPAGPDLALELMPFDFRPHVASTTTFHVEARDHLGGPVWLHACIMIGEQCLIHGAARDSLTLHATPGTGWPLGAIGRVWVWTARVFPDGSAAVGTWGGLRAHFGPGPSLDEFIPYLAAGHTGIPDLGPIEEPPACGSLVGSVCTTLPANARAVQVELFDDAVARPTFQACVNSGTTVLRCAGGMRATTLTGAFPAGATVEVRPYALQGVSPSATKGHALVRTIV